MKRKLALGASLLALSIGAADAAVIVGRSAVVNTSDTEITFTFAFSQPATPIFGATTTRLDLSFALADGARNGAALGVGALPTALGTAQAGAQGDPLTTVLQSGAAQNFAGAGGDPGVVTFAAFSVNNPDPTPKNFQFLFANTPADPGAARVLSVAIAGIFVEGAPADGGSVAPSVNPALAVATLNSGQVAQGSASAGGAAVFAPFADVYPGASGQTADIDCIAPCASDTDIAFTLSPEDSFGAVTRVESGRTGPDGPVTWTYLPGPQFGVFDCGVVGCDQIGATISFKLSPRDALTFGFRFEIAAVDDVPVPAPASLGLLGVGLAALGALRRRLGGTGVRT